MGILKDFKEWLNKPDPRSEVFNRRYEEAVRLRKRHDLLQNAIRTESALNEYVQSYCINQKDELIKELNRLLYDEAEKQGISLYTLCSSVTPEFSYDFSTENPYEGKFNIRFVRTIKLNPNI